MQQIAYIQLSFAQKLFPMIFQNFGIVRRIYSKEILHLSVSHVLTFSVTVLVRIMRGGSSICSGLSYTEEDICLLCFINALFVNVWLNEEQLFWFCSGCLEIEPFQSIFKICIVTTTACEVSFPSALKNILLWQGKGKVSMRQSRCMSYYVTSFYKAVTNCCANRFSDTTCVW